MTDYLSAKNEPFLKYFVAFLETNFFNKGHAGPIRILEVGCGRGEFLVKIVEKYQDKVSITGIDQEKVINEAKERSKNISFSNGSGFLPVKFLDFHEETKFDVVLFTKSLHHIFPLNKAVEHAYSLIRADGFLVAEEFQRDNVSEETIQWFLDRADLLKSAGLMNDLSSEETGHHRKHRHLTFFNTSLSSRERWEANFQNHEIPLPSKQELLDAVTSVFGAENTNLASGIPFLYHLIISCGLKNNEEGKSTLNELICQEIRAIEHETISPIGVVLLAQKK